jgi:hypothetical protein
MINKLIELGHTVNTQWKNCDFKDDSFSQIALDAIDKFDVNTTLEIFESQLASWLSENKLPRQVNTYNSFGQPPVTLFSNEKFVVDVYFWMHVDTSIHSHSFSGAFKILFGKSLHEEFSIKPKKLYSHDVMTSEISLVNTKVLEPSDSHKIVRGNRFNHRLIHIDAPTVTLCIRTINDEESSQWHHFTNGLSIHKKEMSQDVIKSLYYWQYLYYRSNDSAVSFITDKIKSWSISENLNLYEQLSIDQMNLEDELIEFVFNLVRNKYKNDEWFSMYNDFYNEALEYKEIEREESIYRLFEHLLNNNYSIEDSKTVLKKVLKRDLRVDEENILIG